MKSAFSRLNKLSEHSKFKRPEPLTDELLALKEACENDLYIFAKTFWHIVDSSPWRDMWHMQAVAEHLEALFKLEINYLIINAPPRCGKTLISCAIYLAWILIHDPTFSALYTSYAHDLVKDHHIKCRNIIRNPLYQQFWGDRFSILKNVDSGEKFETDKLGFRRISTIRGQGTGFGSTLLVCDDPHNASEINSNAMLDFAYFWWTQSMSSRWTTPELFRKLLIMQRLRVNDLTGRILADESDAVLLRLPMEYESDYKCITVPLKSTNGEPWSDPRTKEGELLCPNLIPKKAVEQLKKEFGSAVAVAGQLQQRPYVEDGNLFKRDWWQWWKKPSLPQIKYVIQSWDTATSKGETACYSCATTWGIFDFEYMDGTTSPHIMLLSVWKKKVEMPDLRMMAIRLSKNYYDTDMDDPDTGKCPPDMIIIEAQMNGRALIDELHRVGVPAVPFNPPKAKMGDITGKDEAKKRRAGIVSPYVEAGQVWLPARPPLFDKLYPFAEKFMQDCAAFPQQESNDVVDSMSQAFMKMRMSGLVGQHADYRPETVYNWDEFKSKQPYIV